MEQTPDQIQSELESFRRQWQEEVSSRARNPETAATSAAASSSSHHQQSQQPRPAGRAGPLPGFNRPPRRQEPPSYTKGPAPIRKTGPLDDDEDYVPAPVFDGDGPSSASRLKGGQTLDGEGVHGPKEPRTALDFYEHAVERESTGKLGDSLQLYRKAFRMDETVDRKYRDKHYAGRWSKPGQQPQQVNPPNAAITVPNPAHHSLEGGSGGGGDTIPLSFPDLIASFAGLRVEGAPPECEGAEPPPCPMAALPDEILVYILRDVAIADVGDFVRLSQVCKRLAFLVATEDRIWRRVCLGSEFGFGGMHHYFQRSIAWEPLTLADALVDPGPGAGEAEVYTVEELRRRHDAESHATTLALYRGVDGYPSWRVMFRRRPRVRFNGCYISTVNYIRPGQNSGQHLTWNTPVHIVTYYRYLRLFRDGTVISLTTTDEPAQVVHHLTRENVATHRGDAPHQHLPSHVMVSALRGRWRLSSARDQDREESNAPPQIVSPQTNAAAGLSEGEGDLYIETEGVVGAKYTYRMDLSLRTAGRSARSNKLVWRGFWSYNRLTDDWAQFALKNDKPFFFSRVKSYGLGE
ncbi:putative f-box protein [Rosellinia necatrix]|uniref:Putative f-box protein n=1 Tax=Rosellinia necatrix TaxID=77044 RepID=A0A1W2TKF5_ROSNE|nr:putative f-box protein [Rosellinia necatrix]